jgi:hypothetical protein
MRSFDLAVAEIERAYLERRSGFGLDRVFGFRGQDRGTVKTDRLDTELLKRGFLGWLRGERGHCSMARVPTIAREDAKRPNRERECFTRPLHASAGPRNRDLHANGKTIKRMFVGRGVQIFARV